MTTSPIELAKALTPWWMTHIREFDGLEIAPCKTYDGDESYGTFQEQCEPHEADCWTVFGHYKTGGIDDFADFKTEAEAQQFHDKLLQTYPHLSGNPDQ